jgi:predicted SnoaL-like aldol condensation-catalyzing enzyme
MPDSITSARKQSAAEFLQLVVEGRIDEAFQKHVDMRGKHHNPFFPASFPSLKTAMIRNHVQFPDKQLIIKSVLGDGDLVAVHSHIILHAGDVGIVAVHVFRFQGDRVIEMWDIGQPVPTNSPNTDGVF